MTININDLAGNSSITPQSSAAPTGSNQLGKTEFLQLLIAQLQNQDPTQPMDNQAMIAQLATFSSLDQQTMANSKLDALVLAQTANNQTSVAALVGKDVTYRSDRVHLPTNGGAATMHANLAEAAANVAVTITDASGKTIRTLQAGAYPQGVANIPWDGKDDHGNPVPAGDYKLSITASRSDGSSVEVTKLTRGRVTGISFDNGYPELLIGTARVKLSDVAEIDQPTTP